MNRWLRWALYLLSLLLFGLILWWGGADAWQQVLAGDRQILVGALGLHGLAGILSATRLQLVARAVAGRELASWRRFYHLNMTARALGLVLPRSVSALGGKSVALRALGISLKRAVWTVMVDNFFDVFLLAALLLPAILFLQAQYSALTFFFLAGVVVAVLAILLWWGMVPGRLRPLFRQLDRFPWLARRLKLETDTAVPFLPSSAQSVIALLLTAALNLAVASSFYLIGRALGLSGAWSLFVAGFSIVQLSLVVAVAPGGIGMFDLGWLGLLRLGGVPETEALTFVIAQRAYMFVFVLVWAGFSALFALTAEKPESVTT